MEKKISTPLTEEISKTLRAGDSILLSGIVYTARDAAHGRLINLLDEGKELPLNINGRICFYYSIFWGILAIFLMKAIQPQVRKFMALILRKFNLSTIRTIILVLTIFIAIDCIISAYAINMFRIRMIAINDLNVAHKDEIIELNLKLNKSKIHSFLIHYFFNDKKMIRTYPNLKQEKLDGTIVYFKDLLPDIKPYYYKFVAKDFYK